MWLTKNIPWKFIIINFIVLRAITILAAVTGLYQLPFKTSFPYSDTVLVPFGHSLIWSWANFDGVHYLMLAKDGYAFGLTQAFFPAYFILIKLINFLINNYLFSALLISHVCFILSLVVFYKLIRLDYSEKIARWAIIFISFFPTSFYFLSVYTESLFLLLLLLTFYFLRKNELFKTGLWGIGLSLSRIVGVFVIPPIFLELKQSREKLNYKKTILMILPSLGLLAYMFYLWLKFEDPLLFAHVQSGFGAGRETDKLVLFYQVIWRYIKMVFTVDKNNPIYFTVWLEMLSSLYVIGLLIWGYMRKIRPSYLLFSFLSFLLPTLTGTFSSMPRYILVLFPIYIVLAMIKNKYLKFFILGIHLVLLFVCTMLFTRGYWIA